MGPITQKEKHHNEVSQAGEIHFTEIRTQCNTISTFDFPPFRRLISSSGSNNSFRRTSSTEVRRHGRIRRVGDVNSTPIDFLALPRAGRPWPMHPAEKRRRRRRTDWREPSRRPQPQCPRVGRRPVDAKVSFGSNTSRRSNFLVKTFQVSWIVARAWTTPRDSAVRATPSSGVGVSFALHRP